MELIMRHLLFALSFLLVLAAPVQAEGKCVNKPMASALQQVVDGLRAVVHARVSVTNCGRHAPHSYHHRSDGGVLAVDLRITRNVRAGVAWLRKSWSRSMKHYGGGLIHLDTGPRGRF